MNQFIEAEIVKAVDVETATQVLQLAGVSVENSTVMLLLSLTTQAFRNGHACFELAELKQLSESHESLALPTEPDAVSAINKHGDIFGTPDSQSHTPRPPFVVDKGKVYISRVFAEEKFIADFLRDNAERVRIVLGGPGTGKTTWVAKTLSQLPDSEIKKLALCAPTGKAAQRMREVLDARLRESGASEKLLDALKRAPSETAHMLLNYAPNRQPQFGFQTDEKLDFGLVIVDEVSMMALSTMYRLIKALPAKCELWLVGDPYQLASVEAGSVLADIDRGAKNSTSPLHSRVKLLEDQHRFDARSSIAKFAEAVRSGNKKLAEEILKSPTDDFRWIDSSKDFDQLDALAIEVIQHARSIAEAAAKGDAVTALDLKSRLQVLSATRKGRLGIDDWNNKIEEALGMSAGQRWYLGRPVMVTRNDRSTKLSNGDVGIVCASDATTRAFFVDGEKPRDISLARLPFVETVHALTIHKSQGSEYDHAIVVIPDGESRIVTRELLYTGITRPKKKLTLIGSLDSILHAVETEIRRASGLEDHLK